MFLAMMLIICFITITVISHEPVIVSAGNTTACANAILADPSTLVSSSATGNDLAFYVYTSPVGYLTATNGTTFLLMSSGNASALAGVPSKVASTDFPPVGVNGDNASLTLTLQVPADVNTLSFDYRFMSEEYPQYPNVNDYFHAVLNDSLGTHQLAFDSQGRAIGVGNNIFDPSINTTGTVFNGATPQITNLAAVVPGETITLTFEVGDAMDGIYDTAVFIDNVRFFLSADNLPPVTTDDYDGLWHTSNFTITLNASDATSVSATYYIINNGATKNVASDGQPQISTQGNNNRLEYWSIDTNGFVEFPHKTLSGIKLDKTAPTSSISIDSGAVSTTSSAVTLSLTYSEATSGVSQVRYSNDGSTWSGWESATTTKAWTLSLGSGTKTVSYQVEDNAGLTTTVSDTIDYCPDTTPPTGTISINEESTYTNSTTVTLTLTYDDDMSGVNQVRYSNDNSTWSNWESPIATKEWTLLSDDGNKTVYFQIEDNVGLTTTLSSSIILDTTPPNANAGNDQSITLGNSALFDGNASSDATGIISYVWDYGDGSPQGSGIFMTHEYKAAGYYTAKLTVTDAVGNNATAVVNIYVQSPTQTASPTPQIVAPTPTPTPTINPTPTTTPTSTSQPTTIPKLENQTPIIIFIIVGGVLVIGLIRGGYALAGRKPGNKNQ
jgi:hypothetical protein